MKIITQNKKSRYNYFFESKLEAGIVLTGSEIKSVRQNGITLDSAYAVIQGNSILLYNSNIKTYEQANRFNHVSDRIRKLLLHKKEINKLLGKLKLRGYSLIPTSAYLSKNNLLKIELAVGKGKKLFDKRNILKQRDWEKDKKRLFKEKYNQNDNK